MIARLRKALSSALGRTVIEGSSPREGEQTEAGLRIEAARKRLKKTIPPRQD